MAAVDYNATTEASTHDLLTLDECKLLLGLALTDTTHDQQLTLQISIYSETVARKCNRIFGRETGVESWREVFDGRVFLTHWPVKPNEITLVTAAGATVDPSAYTLEERSGKLAYRGVADPEAIPWPLPVYVTYTGGYNLPTEAPLPLKQACALLIMEARMRMMQAQVAGIRQITHRGNRVMFFDPNAALIKMAGVSPQTQAVDSILRQYTRFWV